MNKIQAGDKITYKGSRHFVEDVCTNEVTLVEILSGYTFSVKPCELSEINTKKHDE